MGCRGCADFSWCDLLRLHVRRFYFSDLDQHPWHCRSCGNGDGRLCHDQTRPRSRSIDRGGGCFLLGRSGKYGRVAVLCSGDGALGVQLWGAGEVSDGGFRPDHHRVALHQEHHQGFDDGLHRLATRLRGHGPGHGPRPFHLRHDLSDGRHYDDSRRDRPV